MRTVSGASVSKSLQEIFPLSVSNVQYRPGLRLSAGVALVAGNAIRDAVSVPILRIETKSRDKSCRRIVFSMIGFLCALCGPSRTKNLTQKFTEEHRVSWRMRALLLDVFLQVHRADFRAVHASMKTYRNTLCGTRRALWIQDRE